MAKIKPCLTESKLLLKNKVTASSILEVVIAMVIIVIVFGFSLMIYSNVMRLSLSAKKLKAQFVLQHAMNNLEHTTLEQTSTTTTTGWQIEQDIKPYGQEGRLNTVHLTVYDETHTELAELRKIIILNRHD